jgi:hypothetical protein
MKKVILAAVLSAFAAATFVVPVAEAKKKKDAPGKCGVMKYYDKKSKACKSKG